MPVHNEATHELGLFISFVDGFINWRCSHF